MDGLYNMLSTHREAYNFIKCYNKKCQIGIAHNFINFKRAPNGSVIDRKLKRIIHNFYNYMIIDAFNQNKLEGHFPLLLSYNRPIHLNDKIDFWGINYYYRLHVRFRMNLKHPFDLLSISRSSGEGKSDLDWEIYPKGLLKICRWLKSTNKPLIITENGIACKDDTNRIKFLQSHLQMMETAIDEGHDIRGYFYWSLMDNYEWLIGQDARFGLYKVDYSNMQRIKNLSVDFYRDYIQKTTQ